MTAVRSLALCVRCGRQPRHGETFMCGTCLADPIARLEVRAVFDAGLDYLTARRVCIERFHWAGGWGRP